MKLLMIRHGKAGDSDAWEKAGKDDFVRPLTKKGREEFKEAARQLRREVPRIDLLATSPLVRAAQTAKIVYAAYQDEPQFVELDILSGGRPASELVGWLAMHGSKDGVIALVGHEPDLSRWAAVLLTGQERTDMIKVRKGCTLVFEFPDGIRAGKAMLSAMYLP